MMSCCDLQSTELEGARSSSKDAVAAQRASLQAEIAQAQSQRAEVERRLEAATQAQVTFPHGHATVSLNSTNPGENSSQV